MISREYADIFGGLLAAIVTVACGGNGGKTGDGGEPTCLPEPASTACMPLYVPTFANLFDNTLHKTCAAVGCHRAPTPMGGMALDDVNTAYANLTANSTTGQARVTPGDVKCGKVIVRLEAIDEPWSMPPPPGHLQERELCSFVQWIANGAPSQ